MFEISFENKIEDLAGVASSESSLTILLNPIFISPSLNKAEACSDWLFRIIVILISSAPKIAEEEPTGRSGLVDTGVGLGEMICAEGLVSLFFKFFSSPP